MKRLLLVLLLLTSGLALAAKKPKAAKKAPPPPPTAPTPKVTAELSNSVLELLQSSSQVQVWRVEDTGGLRPDPTRAVGADFQRTTAGKALTPEEVTQLKGVIYDERSYRFAQNVGRCRFVPHLSFQFDGGADGVGTVEALVSFSCNQLLFFIGKPGGRWLPGGTFDVRPARKALLGLAKAALPQDGETARLR